MSNPEHKDYLLDEKTCRDLLGGIGHGTYYMLITSRDGEPPALASVKIGRRRFVPASVLQRYIEALIADDPA